RLDPDPDRRCSHGVDFAACTLAPHRRAPPTFHRIPGHERKSTSLRIYLIPEASVRVRKGTHRRGASQGTRV
ncbi:MAG: hypothetical protein ACREVJ_08965, partial [Gammaproteobacteria bacterium]